MKRYAFILCVAVFCILLYLIRPELGQEAALKSASATAEMLRVVPPVFLLLGLFDVWVPRQTIIRLMGKRSGALGIILSITLGAAAAGPLYAAFPVAAAMAKKGARFSNIAVFLGAWSTLKIPMFLFETSSLGALFSVSRWLINVSGIIVIGCLLERLLGPEDKTRIYSYEGKGLDQA
ncbi:MAG: permease [Bacillota bacterium]